MNRILIAGCGDIAMRVARLLGPDSHIYGLVRNPSYLDKLRAAGIIPLPGDLDNRHSLKRLAGLSDTVLHFAPPPAAERTPVAPISAAELKRQAASIDTRTRHLLAALSGGRLPRRLIYISTSGVYGDCKGEIVNETRPTHAQNARAKLRLDAEQQIRRWARCNGVHASILRVPGIYAADRLPVERLKKGTPSIVDAEDGYTNHIHADDLARSVIAALRHAKPNRAYHTCDDSRMKMGAYFDAVAKAFALPPAPRVTRAEAQRVLSPMLLSFMNESRRLNNRRMKQELKVVLRYPTVADTLREIKLGKKPKAASQASAKPALKASAQMEMFPPDVATFRK
jgi:nucleoside-diphosphate-sugar epimerase